MNRIIIFILLCISPAFADTHYVDINSTNEVPPYTSRATAASSIQLAIDQTTSGDIVLVADGVYSLYGDIIIPEDRSLIGENGAESVIINARSRSYRIRTGRNCFISGLTVTNHYVSYSSSAILGPNGIFPLSTVVSNCIISDCRFGIEYARVYDSKILNNLYYGLSECFASNCIIRNNGTGMESGTLIDCMIDDNVTGVRESIMTNCIVTSNSTGLDQGAAYGSTFSNNSSYCLKNADARNCTIINNAGIGIYLGDAFNCTITNNQNYAVYGMAADCTIIGNMGSGVIGNATNCIITDNQGYGVRGYAIDCIIERNNGYGVGNNASNCTVAANQGYGVGGNAIGCIVENNDGNGVGGNADQCIVERNNGNGVSGNAFDCTISDNLNNGVYNGYAESCFILGNHTGIFEGSANNCTLIDNTFGISHSQATNCTISGSQIGANNNSTLSSCTITNNYNPNPNTGCGIVDCSADHCLIADNISEGSGGGARNSTLTHCEVRNNISFQSGGGLYGSDAYNCTIRGNAAFYSGGGLHGSSGASCKAISCLISDNNAGDSGGGIYGSSKADAELINCTVVDNFAERYGLALYNSKVSNCIIYDHDTPTGNLIAGSSEVRFSCAPGLRSGVLGNITNAPAFVDSPNGNFQLDPNSLCINAGLNNLINQPTDLIENPRIATGTVDMGAYEHQAASLIDDDGDGIPTIIELKYQTNPYKKDSDGDGFDDGFEINHGMDALATDSWLIPYVTNHPDAFNLDLSGGRIEIAMGPLEISTSNGVARLSLQLEQSYDLNTWTNAGDTVEWVYPIETNKQFFHVRAEP